jgi:hypothetical protein
MIPAEQSSAVAPYDFQSEFDYGIKLFDWDSASSSRIENAQEGYVFRFSRVRPYFVRFAIDKVITQVDNNILMTRYQPFNPSNPQFDLNPVSFMFKFGITDLLENHKVYGGIRLPFVGINSTSEYFITYENLTKRLDVRYTFYRRSQGDKAFDRLPFSDVTLASGLLGRLQHKNQLCRNRNALPHRCAQPGFAGHRFPQR